MSKIVSPIGPYSVSRKTNDVMFFSGQLPVNPETGQIEKEFTSQCRQVFKNIKKALEDEQLQMNNILKLTVLVTDLSHFDSLNEIFKEFLNEPYPARTAFEVSRLPKDALIEIEAIVSL